MTDHSDAVRRILLIGQCTLHWGRMEFGNIGNYYIMEPLVRELHRVFPSAEIRTTFQMTDGYCARERVTVLPMEFFYSWSDRDLATARTEYETALKYGADVPAGLLSPYMAEVLASDLVVDFSGDIWGRNADFLGRDRFLCGLYKDRTAQLLQRPVVMLAGSPGPFNRDSNLPFVKEVFENFTMVTNREPISTELLREQNFDVSRVMDTACPAFLFESGEVSPDDPEELQELINPRRRPQIGFIACGWNFTQGPFDRWPRDDAEYDVFAAIIEWLELDLQADVNLMSHANGFTPPPADFTMIRGRDFSVAQQLHRYLGQRGIARRVRLMEGVYQPAKTKAIIGKFDLLISGRIHAAVAGLSQGVPTVIMDYGHEPRAHKLRGFARIAGVLEQVVAPDNFQHLQQTIQSTWEQRHVLGQALKERMPQVCSLARLNFDVLPQIVAEYQAAVRDSR